MSIVIAMNRAGKRAWKQQMRRCRSVAERVWYRIVLAWAAPGSSARRVADTVGCSPSTAPQVGYRYGTEGEAGLWDHRRTKGIRRVTDAAVDLLQRPVRGRPPD